jgi:hypothetical protein
MGKTRPRWEASISTVSLPPYLLHTKWEQLAHDIAEPGRPGFKRFLQYYMEELKDQLRGGSRK